MKLWLFVVLFVIAFGITVYFFKQQSRPARQTDRTNKTYTTNRTYGSGAPARTSVFVPHWSLSESDAPFASPKDINRPIDTAIYFAISTTSSGINKNNAGYENIETFVQRAANTPHTLLTVSMTDDAINDVVLENKAAQKTIVSQAITIAQDHDFDGIILDLEVGGIAATKVNTQILEFTKIASEITKKNGLSFSTTLYGDSFYRSRPYSIELLSPYVDQFYVMAYDLSKLWGTPGPNFPLKGRETFGYDMETMVRDLLKFTTNDKLTIIFGLYGHDWTVDEKKRPFTAAKTLTLAQIQQKFIDSCELKNCLVKRNPYAAETEINYIDTEAHYHIVWYEDSESVAQKIGFLKEYGINSVSYWAYSYY